MSPISLTAAIADITGVRMRKAWAAVIFGLERSAWTVSMMTADSLGLGAQEVWPVGADPMTVDPTTTLVDQDFNPIPYSSQTATIDLSAVPEPSSLFLAGAGMLPAAGASWWRRRRAKGG